MKMKRYESKDPKLPGFVEVPEVWLLDHYLAYTEGYAAAQGTLEKAKPLHCQIAGVLVLLQRGVIKASLPGLVVAEGSIDISSMDMRVIGVLERVADQLEATRRIPLVWSEESVISTTEASPTDG